MLHLVDNQEGDLAASREKERQLLLAELDLTKHLSRGKDQKISKMEEELQTKQKEMSFLTDQLVQSQKESEILQQKGQAVLNVADCDEL